ncbi:SDR family NAD(P)-dependent oxidoreductase [Sphingobium sp. CAP-1]|uniref:SDR family NAD(P)-dependent oxidoreductase n=1 Tax=Sphingobium sp. CAP-1 TaxID=2676077 RepID=UPI0012BB4067|nr:SDR family NAD(P)-dependent oxidoreductase [Sphingobium sp. CAP-1]QGP80998.1 SDR family NAD(P)-dependent oxidoreductase [Sphingobium sp. CAP-1]
MTQVAGRTAFITGGGSGVALGQAKIFAQAGCKVAIADIRQDHLDEAMAWFEGRGHEVMAVKLDIADRAAYARAADEVEAKLGPVELLFNTAGVSIFGPLQNATYDDWDWQLDVNLKGVINGIQTFVPRMIERGKGGHIVNTASMSAFVALKGTGIYCTSKMAIRGLSECLALDLADHGIGVSMLCPGAVNSNIHEAVLTRPAHLQNTGYYGADPNVMAHLKQVIAVGMEPEVLAQYVLKGVEADQLYILPYPEFRGTLEEIHERVMAAVAQPQDDPDYARRVAHGVPGGEKRETVDS